MEIHIGGTYMKGTNQLPKLPFSMGISIKKSWQMHVLLQPRCKIDSFQSTIADSLRVRLEPHAKRRSVGQNSKFRYTVADIYTVIKLQCLLL